MRNFTSCLAYLLPVFLMFIAIMLSMGSYEMDMLGVGFAAAALLSYYPCVCMGQWLWRDGV